SVHNLLPDPRLAPAVEPARHRRPGAKAGRQIPPWGTSAQDPQDATEHCAVIVVRAPRPWFLRREQGAQLLPSSVAEFFTCHTLSLKAVCRHALVLSSPVVKRKEQQAKGDGHCSRRVAARPAAEAGQSAVPVY